jgi:hypothetical protein
MCASSMASCILLANVVDGTSWLAEAQSSFFKRGTITKHFVDVEICAYESMGYIQGLGRH